MLTTLIEQTEKKVMMPEHEFCDDCPGCRPALLDVKTGKVMAPDDPVMTKINDVWDNETTYAQRRAFIEVTLHNSRNPVDMKRFEEVVRMSQNVMKE